MLDNMFKAMDKDQNGILTADEAAKLVTYAVTQSPFVPEEGK